MTGTPAQGPVRRAVRAVADAAGAVRRAIAGTAEKAEEAAEDVADKAQAVQETAERAQFAPKALVAEVRDGVREVAPEIVKMAVAGLIVVVLVATAYIVFAVSLVAVLNRLLGDPWGTVVAWVLLTLAALGGVVWMRKTFEVAKEETGEAVAGIEGEVDYVTAPVRREFGPAEDAEVAERAERAEAGGPANVLGPAYGPGVRPGV